MRNPLLLSRPSKDHSMRWGLMCTGSAMLLAIVVAHGALHRMLSLAPANSRGYRPAVHLSAESSGLGMVYGAQRICRQSKHKKFQHGVERTKLAAGSHAKILGLRSFNSQKRSVAAAAEAIPPAVIIGGGRVGQALKNMGSGGDVILGRYDLWPENAPEGPIFVATRNDALDDVIEKVPEHRREDIVFMQNGMLEPYLNKMNLSDATQVLVYFAVAKLGDPPTDGITDMNPEGLTAAYGKWAEAAADRFHNQGLSCKVLNKEEFRASMFEKLIWICSFMLVGARHPGATVGDVESKHTEEVTRLIDELAAAVPDVKFESKLAERLRSYARSVSHFPTAVKEFQWRNGYFNDLSVKAYKEGEKKDPLPLHSTWLAEIGQGKVVPFPFEGYKEHITEEEMREQDEILKVYEKKREEERQIKLKKKQEAEEKRRLEKEKADTAKKEKELKEEQVTKARQLEMAKTAAEEETKRSRRKAGI